MPVVMTENTSIDYDVRGGGPPLLLVNGLGFGRWGWFRQVPAFAWRFRTVTFDVRGERGLENGVADLTGEVVALLDHLGIGKAHVLGTSLGGFVAQELALGRPDLVDRLVLVCTSYGGRGPEAMSPGALADVMGFGSFGAESAARRALAAATSRDYRAADSGGVRADRAVAPGRLVVGPALLRAGQGRRPLRPFPGRPAHNLPDARGSRLRGPLRPARQRPRPGRGHPRLPWASLRLPTQTTRRKVGIRFLKSPGGRPPERPSQPAPEEEKKPGGWLRNAVRPYGGWPSRNGA